MSLTPTQKSLCNKLATDYEALVSPVKSAKNLFKSHMGSLDSKIRGMVFSDPTDLDAAVGSFINSVQGSLPGDDIESMQELADFIRTCDYLSGLAPASTVNGTYNGIFSDITNFISDLTPSFPEFGAAAIADGINSLLSGIGFPGGSNLTDLLKQADKLLNCLNVLCGPDYGGAATEISDDLNTIYTDYNLIDSGPNAGKFDFDSFYTASGLDASQQAAINTVTNSIGEQKTGAVTAVNKSIDKVKSLKKIGGFF